MAHKCEISSEIEEREIEREDDNEQIKNITHTHTRNNTQHARR